MISCTGFMTASRPTAFVDAGGGQRTFGVFAEDYLRPECWVFTLGGRLDNWVNSRGFSNRVSVSASPTLATFPNRSEIGGEAGIGLQTFVERLTICGNFFWNTIDDPISM